MVITKTLREPNEAVATAISSALQHKKFKRMLLFSLRSLSDLCVPPTLLYKENSLDAIQRGIIQLMYESLTQFSDDQELGITCIRIMYGISEYLKDSPEQDKIEFVKNNGVGVFESAVHACSSIVEKSTIKIACNTLENFNLTNIKGTERVAISLVSCLESTALGPKEYISITSALLSLTKVKDSVIEMAKAKVGTTIMGFLTNLVQADPDTICLIGNCFDIIKSCAMNGDQPEGAIISLVAVIDHYKNYRSITDKGGSCIQIFMKPQQLTESIATIKSKTATQEEKNKVLTILSAMSYVNSFADEIAEQGGIPLIIDTLNQSVNEYSNEEYKITSSRAIIASLSVLSKISMNPQYIQTLVDSNGVESIIAAFSSCTDNLDILSATCLALGPLFARETIAVSAANILGDLLQLLYNNSDSDNSFKDSAVELLSIASQHAELAQALIPAQAVEIIATCLNYVGDSSQYLLSSLSALLHLSAYIQQIKTIHEFGGLDGITKSLKTNFGNETISSTALELLVKLSLFEDSKTYLCNGELVDVIFEIMLTYPTNAKIQESGLTILEQIAQKSDLDRHVQSFPNNASNNIKLAYNDLAAISSLSIVSSLKSSFKGINILDEIFNKVQAWITAKVFDDQEKIIKASFQTIVNVSIISDDLILAKSIVKLLEIASLPQMKTFADKDESENLVIENMRSVKKLINTSRLEDESSITNVVIALISTIRKFVENKSVQLQCIKSFITIANSSSGGRIEVDNGLIKVDLAFLQRTKLLINCQLSGYKLLSILINTVPDSLDIMRKSGVTESIQSTLRMHNKNLELKRLLSPMLLLLVPLDELRKLIYEKCQLINSGILSKDLKIILENLNLCNEMIVAPEGVKFAVAEKLADFLPNIIKLSEEAINSNSDDTATALLLLVSVANAGNLLSSQRIGKLRLLKTNVIDDILIIHSRFIKVPITADIEDGLTDNLLLLAGLVKFDLKAAEEAFDKGAITIICKSLETFSNSDKILSAACTAIASMATSPKRIKALLSEPTFNQMITQLITTIEETSKSDVRFRCLKVINDLINSGDLSLVQVLADTGSLTAAFNVLDRYIDELQTVISSAGVLNNMASYVDLRGLFVTDLRKYIEIVIRALEINKDNEECVLELIKLLNNLTTSEDNNILKDCALIELLQTIMNIHNDNPEIIRRCGELISKCDASDTIKGLMIQIITIQQSNDPDTPIALENLVKKLAVYVTVNSDTPDDTYQYTEKSLQALSEAIKQYPNETRLISEIAVLTQRCVDRVYDNSEDAYGSWAVTSSGMLQTLIDLFMDKDSKSLNSKKFISSSLKVFTGCLHNPYTKAYGTERFNKNFLANIDTLFNKYNNDPVIIGKIYEFLKELAIDPEGAALVTNTKIGTIDQILVNIKNNRKSDNVLISGLGLIGNLIAASTSGGFKLDPNILLQKKELQELENIIDTAQNSDIREVSFCNMISTIINSGLDLQDTNFENRQLRKFRAFDEDENLNNERRITVAVSVAKLIEAFSINLESKQDASTFDIIGDLASMLQTYPKSPDVVKQVGNSLKQVIKMDENAGPETVKVILPVLNNSNIEVLSSDPYAADSIADMLIELSGGENNGILMRENESVPPVIDALSELAKYYEDEFGQQLSQKIELIKQNMANDQPKVLTLKAIYELLQYRISQEQTINYKDSTVVEEKLQFIIDRMKELVKNKMSETEEADFMYGCLSIPIVVEIQDNIDLFVSNEWPMYMFTSLLTLNPEVQTGLINSIVDICKSMKAAIQCATSPNAAKITTQLLDIANKDKNLTSIEKENFLISRLSLVEKTAVSRQLYIGTKMLNIMLSIWDSYDQNIYSIEVLRHIFRGLRRIVSDEFVTDLMKADVIKRLIDITDKKKDIIILPDVLYLLGSLAIIPDIKTDIGENKGIETICDLLKASQKMELDTIAPTVTNGCLSLANLTIQHNKNKAIFMKYKGGEMIKSLFNVFVKYWDVINSLGVLIGNLGYKKDDTKKQLGSIGIPDSIIYFLNNYQGELDKTATRAFMTVLKSTANLCLYVPNIKLFTDGHIDKTFQHLLQVSQDIPKETLASELYTLLNITSENEVKQLEVLGILIEPLIALLSTSNASDPSIQKLLLDCIFMLCRSETNASKFYSLNGIDIVIKSTMKNDYDLDLMISSIKLLTCLTDNNEHLTSLINSGIFRVVVNIIENNQEGSGDLKIATLRLLKKCVAQPENALDFISMGGAKSLCETIKDKNGQSSVLVEAVRVLLGLLYWGSPDPNYSSLDAPRGYQVLQMTDSDCNAVINSITASIQKQGNEKNLRLMKGSIGILNYFLSEKVSVDEISNSNNCSLFINTASIYPQDEDFTYLVCQLLAYIGKFDPEFAAVFLNDESVDKLFNLVSKSKSNKKGFLQLVSNAYKEKDCSKIVEIPQFNFDTTHWDEEPYPNGVQDLPKNVKDALRNGGRFKIVYDNNTREEFKWKASQDLYKFEWKVGKESEYNQSISITKIVNIWKGLQNDILKVANVSDPRKVVSSVCFVIVGPKTEDEPQGMQLSLKAKSKYERDTFIDYIVMWREAASYRL